MTKNGGTNMNIDEFMFKLADELYKISFYNIKIVKEYNNLDKTFLLDIRCKRYRKNYKYGISIHENWLDDNSINEIIKFLLMQ